MSDDDKALDLAELRRVAEAATTDVLPWFTMGQMMGEGRFQEDAEHIATFDPATVLALLDRLDRLEVVEEERDTSDVEVRLLGEACDRLQARAEAAEAKVARVEALRDRYDLSAQLEGYGGELWSSTSAAITAALRGDA